jgi:4-hydroxy-tetrahydrodipicolinate reductase
MHIEMAAGAEAPLDRVDIEGDPPLSLVVPGGVPGDLATAAVVVNAAHRVASVAPGLVTMADLPPPHAVRRRPSGGGGG